ANLPPGVYTLTIHAQGFSELRREGIGIEVGHLPTLDLVLQVGAASQVVEVSGAAPLVDVTTNTNQTNLTTQALNDVPHGYSFQSVIQYAPMARDEPLAGGAAGMAAMSTGGMGNSGGGLPGSSGNGQSAGFSIGGAADSETTYLVEGQDTENISGGASQANVPFQFIQEVAVETSAVQAEHGGALGGVVNVIMKKGANEFHGSLFGSYESNGMDGSAVFDNQLLRYDPVPTTTPPLDADSQIYVPKRDNFRIVQPGFTIGGPIVKDRLWFFAGFAPQDNSLARTVNFNPPQCTAAVNPIPCSNAALGNQLFNQSNQTYFGTARLDFALTQKVRLFGSWLYQYARESGASLPGPDSVNGLFNSFINSPLTQYSNGLGFSAPGSTYNVGADITLTPKIVSTTRFGYFFTNYHDFGWPNTGVDLSFITGLSTDNTGATLPPALNQPGGASTAPFDQSYTQINANKHYQFDQDVAFFKGGWWGTHNIKVGYQLNHLSNVIDQHGNLPFVNVIEGGGIGYTPFTTFGAANCAALEAEWAGNCTGQYGFVEIQDFATILKNSAGNAVPASDWNHALFAQDAWTIGHGLTLNLGLRVEKESLPAPPGIGIADIRSINFSWGDKIEPRLGAAWGSANGKLKIFGSYGVINDVMKLLLAQTSWGAQGFEVCAYPLGPDAAGTFVDTDMTIVDNAGGRACPTGVSNVGASFANGVTPAVLTDKATGVSLIENVNFRPEEPIAPNVKPYRQHEFVGGVDYQLGRNWALEARYDRRRLDHVIEDASLDDPNAGEIYTVVNPGQGVDKTFDGYANFLTSLGDAYGPGTAAFNPHGAFGSCPTCPNMPQAIRNYDGVEFRLTRAASRGWAGMFSYTYSSLWGDYTGLTTTDQVDGGVTGRNSPDTTRSFDEPFYYFKYNGQHNYGPLPTDRPNTVKGYAYYNLPWKGMTSSIGLFQVAYQGSPSTSYIDIGEAGDNEPLEATYLYGRGQWVPATADATGAITLGTPYARRTPWYTQTDANLQHAFRVNKNNEAEQLKFTATLTNLLNQHAVTSYWGSLDSIHYETALFPNGETISDGANFYKAAETGYNPQVDINASKVILHSGYSQPNLWQSTRRIRLAVQFTF
ncbi:MAG: TonB-dependent receptor, partial [Candidatus Sulfotelmatobacter sp.]